MVHTGTGPCRSESMCSTPGFVWGSASAWPGSQNLAVDDTQFKAAEVKFMMVRGEDVKFSIGVFPDQPDDGLWRVKG